MTNTTRDENYQLSQQEIEALKMTQDIIKRMAENSSKTKTAFVAITGMLSAFIKFDTSVQTIVTLIIYLFITTVLWITDSIYLRLERQFREHHKKIVEGTISTQACWLMQVTSYPVESSWKTMYRNFTLHLYVIPVGATIVGVCYIICNRAH
ncbi:MAG: hypothetical protein SOR95_05965 [Sutterella sp.]|nr:hypothetical protein [Sutterella sp.]